MPASSVSDTPTGDWSPFLKPPGRRRLSRQKVTRRLHRTVKEVYQRLSPSGNRERQIAFVVGCQRSGTDMVTLIFEKDWHTKVYPEVSRISSDDPHRRLRLNALPKVKREFDRDHASLIVLKPLVESQNVVKLLDSFPGSKAIWLYRDYRDVAQSHIQKWSGQNSINDLRAIVDDVPENWRSENVSDEVQQIVKRNFDEAMSGPDAAALYWFVRNRHFVDLCLHERNDVLLCQYERLVAEPAQVMPRLFEFVNRPYPGDRILRQVHALSVGAGAELTVSPNIDEQCNDLLVRLDQFSNL